MFVLSLQVLIHLINGFKLNINIKLEINANLRLISFKIEKELKVSE